MQRSSRDNALLTAPTALLLVIGLWIGPKYDRFVLPAFDGHVYAAMAENPRFFTLAPWGYRILGPSLVHVLPFRSVATGFYWLNLCLLCGVIFVTGWWLRRLGFSSVAAALASAAFAISPPIRVLLEYQILVDPLALLLLVIILSELTTPDVPTLMGLFALAALTKETTLLFLVLIPLHLAATQGLRRGLFDTMVIAAPALFLSFVLRASWGRPGPPGAFSMLDVTLGRVIDSAWLLAVGAALSGLTFVAIAGGIRETSSVLRLQAFLIWVATFALILANPYHYSAADLPRLSVFAWPAMLPLALKGLGFRRADPVIPIPNDAHGRTRSIAAMAALGVAFLLVAATDRYERVPFPPDPDAIAVVGRIRESMKTAELLDKGGTFEFDARAGRFASQVTETFNLTETRKQRWFLLSGFGSRAAFGAGAPSFAGDAQILLPVFRERDATLMLEVEGEPGTAVCVAARGRVLASIEANAGPQEFRIPRSLLVRGDNVMDLRAPPHVRIRLQRLEVKLDPPWPR